MHARENMVSHFEGSCWLVRCGEGEHKEGKSWKNLVRIEAKFGKNVISDFQLDGETMFIT